MNNILSFIFLLTIANQFSQDPSVHIPWELTGAHERIDQHRKGKAVLKFILNKKINKNTKADINVNLINHEFKFGVSLTQARRFYGQDYYKNFLERVSEAFNYVTIGMYWALTDERNRDKNIENYYEDVLDWATKNNIKTKGHPLMWHEAMPKWVRNFENMEELEVLMKNHMRRLIKTYPQIHDWDVYNEPIGPFKPHIPENSISKWIKYKGGINPAMIEIYNYVNSVDSTKNYSNNHYHAKDPEFFKINKFFIENNLRYQAIGMQAHMQSNDNVMSEKALWKQIEDYAVLGKNIQFTEITVTSSKRFKNWKDHQVFLKERDEVLAKGGELNLPSLPEYEKYQSDYLKDFYTLAFSHPSVSSVTFWNLTDQNAWRGHAGGLTFSDLKPKMAFNTLKNLIKVKWNTKVSSEFKLDDNFNFNGFYGEYEGNITIKNKNYFFSFNHNSKNSKNPIKIYLN
jgi:GH35 family endo-1,4-beta-xylanase